MKFRKIPVTVEAVQWHGWGTTPSAEDLGITAYDDPINGWIRTLEGGHIVTPGDWIITGVKGERYPCKPDIFEMTYEPAETF